MLVSNAKFTRKTRPLLDVDELSKLLLGRQVLGWIASAKPFPINDLRLRLGLIERCICRHRSLAGVDSIGIHGVEPRKARPAIEDLLLLGLFLLPLGRLRLSLRLLRTPLRNSTLLNIVTLNR